MILQTPQTLADSFTITNLQQQIDSLTTKINDIGIGLEHSESIPNFCSNPSLIIAISAVIVSLFGIGSSIFYNRRTLKLTKEHNKKSVEPNISCFGFNRFVKGKGYQTIFEIKNSGLGPAKILDVKFTYCKRDYQDFYSLIRKEKEKLSKQFFKDGQYIYSFDDTTISPNESLNIYDTGFTIPEDGIGEIITLLNSIILSVKYASMYNEQYSLLISLNKVGEQHPK